MNGRYCGMLRVICIACGCCARAAGRHIATLIMLPMVNYDTASGCVLLLLLHVVCIHFRRTSFDGPLSSRNWSLSMFSRSDLERKRRMQVYLLLSCVLTNDMALLNVVPVFSRITVITIRAILSGWSRE
jgi:hypothetical protein